MIRTSVSITCALFGIGLRVQLPRAGRTSFVSSSCPRKVLDAVSVHRRPVEVLNGAHAELDVSLAVVQNRHCAAVPTQFVASSIRFELARFHADEFSVRPLRLMSAIHARILRRCAGAPCCERVDQYACDRSASLLSRPCPAPGFSRISPPTRAPATTPSAR